MIDLLEHNLETYNRVKELWKQTNEVAVVQATGTGKSYLIAAILNDFKEEKKLVIAPSKFILNQLKDKFGFNDPNTFYLTYSKLFRLKQEQIDELDLKLIVLDEYHRAGAEEWGKGVEKILLSYPNAFKFGTTATPIRHLDDARNMSIELFKGNLANNMNLAQAIAKGLLPSPKYVSALYTLDNIIDELNTKVIKDKRYVNKKQEYLQKLNDIKLDFKKSYGIPKILQKHLNINYKKFVVFLKDYKHLLLMEPVINSWFSQLKMFKNVNTYRVVTAEPLREKSFIEFKEPKTGNQIDLLLSVDMFNEGLHIPGVDGVILLRETESPNVFYQQIGRCLITTFENHPIIFDFVNNFRSVHADDFLRDLEYCRKQEFNNHYYESKGIEPPEFMVIDETLEINELFGHIKFSLDPWELKLEKIKKFHEEHGHLNIPYSHPELGKYLRKLRKNYELNTLSQDKIDALNKLGFIWRLIETYPTKFEKLVEFKAQYGHLNIPRSHPELGVYVQLLRTKRKKNKLSDEVINSLTNLGFDWTTRVTTPFEKKVENLKTHLDKKGNLNSLESNSQLYNFIYRCRHLYQTNKLLPERIAMLNSIGFIWENKDPNETFEKNFALLKEFSNKHGHLNMTYKWQLENKIAPWIKSLRRKKNQLDIEKKKRLKEIGFELEPKNQFWENFIQLLVTSKSKKTALSDLNRKKLTHLENYCRVNKNKLTNEQISQLDSLGFLWEKPLYNSWLKSFELLVNFEKKFNSIEVPAYKEYEHLNTWLNRQKHRYASNKLEKWKIDKLNSLPSMDWTLKVFKKGESSVYKELPDFHYEKGWNDKFSRLQEFYNTHGNTNIHFSDRPLYLWKYAQIRRYKEGKLREDRINLLKQIGLIT